MSVGWMLAVDFGTVNTGAAVRWPDERIDKVKLDPASDTMPSAVMLDDDGWRVGQSALNARRSHPETFIGSPKARLGQEPTVLGTTMVTPAQIASRVLAVVRERAIRAAGGTDPVRVVLTHPVRWGSARLSALTEAARLAGFPAEQIHLLPEPVAALHAHVTPWSLPNGSRVAVVDTGGGTCDVAILQTTDDPVPGKDLIVVAQEGDDRLGGNDLDNLLYAWTVEQLGATGHAPLVELLRRPENLGAALALLDVVRGAKQDLSEHVTAPIAVAVTVGQETTLTITRDEYEALVAEPMRRAAALVARAMQVSGTTDLAALYLTGGTAYTPALARALQEVTGILAAPLGDPKLAVAVGALRTPAAVLDPDQLRAVAAERLRQRRDAAPPAPQAPVDTLLPGPTASLPPRPPTAPTPPLTPVVPPADRAQPPTGPPVASPPPTAPMPPAALSPSVAPSQDVAVRQAAGLAPAGPETPDVPAALAAATRGDPASPIRVEIVSQPGTKHTGRTAVLVAAALLVLLLVGGGIWWFGHGTAKPTAGPTSAQDNQPASTSPQTNPSPNSHQTTASPGNQDLTPVETAYPKLTGLDGALAAFPLAAGENPECKEGGIFGDKEDSIEQFQCDWPMNGGLVDGYYTTIIRYANADTGINHFRNKYDTETESTWSVGGTVRGPAFTSTAVPATGSRYYTYCYNDVPYCIEFLDLLNKGPDKALARFNFLSKDAADELLARSG